MLVLERWEVENYLSYQGVHSFTYAQSGIYLIKGINYDDFVEGVTEENDASVGSGKSTFCSIPAYAFFGVVSKDINKDDVTNKKSKKNCRVSLEFRVNDRSYKIDRYRKHSVHSNDVLLFEKNNDEWCDITPNGSTLIQKTINELLMINSDMFIKSNILSRDDYQQFMKYTPIIRSKSFESVIQLNKLKIYLKRVEEKIKSARELNVQYHVEVETIIRENATYKEYMDDESGTNLIKEQKLTQEIEQLQNKINLFINKKSNLDDVDMCYYLVQQYRDILTQLTFCNSEKLNALTRLNDLTIQKNILLTQANHAQVRLDKHVPMVCSKCQTVFSETQFKNDHKLLQTEFNLLSKEIASLETTEQKIQSEISDINRTIDGHNEPKASVELLIHEIKLPKEIKKQIMQDAKDNKPNSIALEIAHLNQQLLVKQTELRSITWDNIKKLQLLIENNTLEQKRLLEEKQLIENKIQRLEYLSRVLDIQNENSIKQHMIQQVIPVFNNIIQQNMNKIYNGTLTLAFDQFFNDTIIKDDDQYKYHELSTGERVKVDLGINLSLFDMVKINLNGCSVLFLDEIFSNVDNNTIKSALKLIKTKYAKDAAVYLITHNPLVYNHLKNCPVIRVIKENKKSRIEI